MGRASSGALAAVVVLLAGCAAPSGKAAPRVPVVTPGPAVTLARLFDELSDLSLLARRASPRYASKLASSFDRDSAGARPGEPGWFANRDFLRPAPGEAATILEVSGPGAITRIWSANPSGVLRVYLDGSDTPAIEAELKPLLRGEVQPFAAPFAFQAGGGYNLYFPITFARGCRVTITSDAKRLYYQIDYRAYEAGTRVESFSSAAVAAAQPSQRTAADRLDRVAGAIRPAAGAATFSLAAEPGVRAAARLLAAHGGSAITELRVRPSRLDAEALRGTMLSIAFDGEVTVEAPLGDFFGTGPGLAPVRSLPVTVDAVRGLLIARWTMPFQRNAEIALTGTAGPAFDTSFEVVRVPYRWDDEALYFHARWQGPSWRESEPPHDWTLSTVQGGGTYVGTLVNVVNGDALWWGEGDEKIFVDGEAFPSHFGTGTEDYFGYAWCSNAVFSEPFVGQTRADARQNYGAVSMYRFHTLDAIPFTTGLRFDLEVHHWGETPVPMAYDAVAFFYARPGARAEPVARDPALYYVPLPPPPPDVRPSEYTCGRG